MVMERTSGDRAASPALAPRTDDTSSLGAESVLARSNLSGILVGEFLGPHRHAPGGASSPTGRDSEHTPLLGAEAAPTPGHGIVQPSISSMGNASGFGTIRPPSHTVWTSPDDPTWDVSDEEDEYEFQHEPLRHEIKALLRFTMPICATHILELSLSVVSVLSLGHLGTVELASASLAGMTANVTGFSVISGLITALDTLLPATFTRNPRMMGLWTQRVGVIIALTLPWIILLWLNAERFLLHLGQEPEIAHKARQFLAILAIGLPGHAIFELCRRYLQAQGLMHAPTIVLLVVSPINALANFLLVWGPESIRLGFLGAPLASALSMWLMAILCFLQCTLVSQGTWGGWSWKAFDWDGLKTSASLGFAGLLSLASEWWAWEIVGLVTAALGTTALASQSVLLITSSVTYQLPSGAAVAASVRVGNLLGAGKARHARTASTAAIYFSIFIGLVNSSIVFFTRHQLGFLFSSDKEVVRLVATVLPIVALFQIADCICGIAGGILRGCGRQSLSAIINVTAYYAAGIPTGLFLAFGPWHLGLAGLWWGLTSALIYGAVFSLWYVHRMDWIKIMHQIHHTMHDGSMEA
ncbi:ethionine resistance protein [Malassezia pachydermatis]|uniref:Multidrug oligosaccharidyl-lipid polysaccharide flippase n=1 Tax=Malassezia pachydermatis TaxID=77020 RepID=A0A0M8MKZ8_9BASI|nr:multidrug oligosaccharidyl-lipid polysaccharide flippase [Malassezia pachydermatis]KOS13658.1 multidrug oligosaccharidyl-lipid polysaccharide flippase [Malassezia pachydermatis]